MTKDEVQIFRVWSVSQDHCAEFAVGRTGMGPNDFEQYRPQCDEKFVRLADYERLRARLSAETGAGAHQLLREGIEAYDAGDFPPRGWTGRVRAALKTDDDSARLDWVLRNVSGAEWLRLGIIYSAGMTRDHLDRRIAPDVNGVR